MDLERNRTNQNRGAPARRKTGCRVSKVKPAAAGRPGAPGSNATPRLTNDTK